MVRGVLLAHLWPFVWGLPFLGLTCVPCRCRGAECRPSPGFPVLSSLVRDQEPGWGEGSWGWQPPWLCVRADGRGAPAQSGAY